MRVYIAPSIVLVWDFFYNRSYYNTVYLGSIFQTAIFEQHILHGSIYFTSCIQIVMKSLSVERWSEAFETGSHQGPIKVHGATPLCVITYGFLAPSRQGINRVCCYMKCAFSVPHHSTHCLKIVVKLSPKLSINEWYMKNLFSVIHVTESMQFISSLTYWNKYWQIWQNFIMA